MNIELIPWTEDHFREYLDIVNRADLRYEYLGVRCEDEAEAARRLRNFEYYRKYGFGHYLGIVVDGHWVGHAQIVIGDGIHSHESEVGCILVPEACGRGIGTEVLRRLVQMAFAEPRCTRLTALVYAPNIASRRMMEKLGFTLEATKRRHVRHASDYFDALIYALLREEYML